MIHNLHCVNDNGSGLSTHLADEEATLQLGSVLASALTPGLRLWLEGDLGSGKTTLTRGILRGLGHEGKVKSPTYTLIEPYTVSRLNLYHFDFYRFTSPNEFLDAGLDEYFAGTGICIVEWPDKASPYLGPPDITITLVPEAQGRHLHIAAYSLAGHQCIKKLILLLPPQHPVP